jgi:digeranylgeranylglycerophospholipid reductase
VITRNDWDILVVGAGPAGSRAAAVESAKGLSVLLIDAKTRLGEQPHCGEAVSAQLFDDLDLDKSCWIQLIESIDTFILDWDTSEKRSLTSSSGLPRKISESTEMPMAGVTIDRVRFDRNLARVAAASGATVISSARFVRREKDVWVVRCMSGEVSIRPKLVIGADGTRSRVAAEMGLVTPEMAVGLQVEVPIPRPTRTISIFLSRAFYGGYGWLIPKGRVANAGIGVIPRSSESPRDLLERFLESLSRLGMIRPGKLAVYAGMIPGSGMRETLVRDNVLFCGDAGGLTDPLTGAGIAQAVISGSRAGDAAANAVQTGTDLPLRDYEASTKDLYWQRHEQALRTRKLMMTRWDEPDFERMCRETWLACMAMRQRGMTISSYLRGGGALGDNSGGEYDLNRHPL